MRSEKTQLPESVKGEIIEVLAGSVMLWEVENSAQGRAIKDKKGRYRAYSSMCPQIEPPLIWDPLENLKDTMDLVGQYVPYIRLDARGVDGIQGWVCRIWGEYSETYAVHADLKRAICAAALRKNLREDLAQELLREGLK